MSHTTSSLFQRQPISSNVQRQEKNRKDKRRHEKTGKETRRQEQTKQDKGRKEKSERNLKIFYWWRNRRWEKRIKKFSKTLLNISLQRIFILWRCHIWNGAERNEFDSSDLESVELFIMEFSLVRNLSWSLLKPRNSKINSKKETEKTWVAEYWLCSKNGKKTRISFSSFFHSAGWRYFKWRSDGNQWFLCWFIPKSETVGSKYTLGK